MENVREKVMNGEPLQVKVLDGTERVYTCNAGSMTEEEKKILLAGCLINYYKSSTK